MKRVKRVIAVAAIFCLLIASSTPLIAGDNVNINTADQVELCTLKKVGEKCAKNIIDYRSKQKFQTPDEIMQVKGIGPKIFEMNKDRIVIEDKKS